MGRRSPGVCDLTILMQDPRMNGQSSDASGIVLSRAGWEIENPRTTREGSSRREVV
jgi:hypothetical protein